MAGTGVSLNWSGGFAFLSGFGKAQNVGGVSQCLPFRVLQGDAFPCRDLFSHKRRILKDAIGTFDHLADGIA